MALRQAGHDVLWVREAAPGSPDSVILARAQAEERLLLTFDKDFGDLVFHQGLAASHGIVLFRILQPSAPILAQRVVAILGSRNDWHGQYSVAEEHSIRMRPLA
jgi:predicted nuclease of predicted toxin-antitoxin system